MTSKRPISRRSVEKLSERERAAGLDAGDDAAQWLAANDKQPPPQTPKRATKSKALHQWRQQQQKKNGKRS
jgi:hypothetical protein